jgi:hypothetical protein
LQDKRIYGKITQKGPKNYPLQKKVGGRKITKFGKKWQNTV